jgi:hypothetical protein
VLEPGEAAFDAVALSIEFFVVSPLLFSVGFGGHDSNRSHGFDVVQDGLAMRSWVELRGKIRRNIGMPSKLQVPSTILRTGSSTARGSAQDDTFYIVYSSYMSILT